MTPPDELTAGQWQAIDAACCRFEAAWTAGGRPALADYLRDIAGPARPVLFQELLAVELDARRDRGEQIWFDDYAGRWAEFRDLLPEAFAAAGLEPAARPGGSTMKCPRCGADNPAGRATCGGCNKPLPQVKAAPAATSAGTVRCSRCGREMPAGAKFCGFDGTLLQPAEAGAKGTPAPPPPSPPVLPPPLTPKPVVTTAPPPPPPKPAPSPTPVLPGGVTVNLDMRGAVREERREGVAELISPRGALREMVLIPAGEFQMGSPDGTGRDDEHPRHKVRLSAFYIDRYAVSNADYEKFDPAHAALRPDLSDGDDDPAVMVSYHDALRYCRWRSEREGLPPETYLLPTEAQWERAARGGYPDRAYPWGDAVRPDVCNTLEAGRGRAVRTADGLPNGFLLFHMGGNVREWCWDAYAAGYYAQPTLLWSDPRGPVFNPLEPFRVVRGASFLEAGADYGRCAARGFAAPAGKQTDIGFRCARAVTVR